MAHLVFQTAFPGDLFLSIPLLKNIRAWDPASPLVLACRPGLGEYFLKMKLVDEVIEVDKRNHTRSQNALRQLRAREWDVIFVPHESVRTALWIYGLKAKTAKVGFHKWWNRWVFSRRVLKPMQLPDALRQLSLLSAVDIRFAERFAQEEVLQLANRTELDSPLSLNLPTIPLWASMQMGTQASGETIFLAPGSVWDTKRWTVEGFTQVAAELIKRGKHVALVGSPAEVEICARIQAAVPQVENLAGKTSLSGLAEKLRSGRALVCNDSGAMHAAAAAGLPTVAVFGPTTLALGFRPWQNNAVVVQKSLSCRPCGKHGAKSCPIKTHACMKSISAQEVLQALDQLLA